MDLLELPQIKQLLSEHPNKRDSLQTAASQLEGAEDAERSMCKVAKSILQNQINVFFSYKLENHEDAEKIVNMLRLYSAGRIHVTFAGDFQEDLVGKKWWDAIKTGLATSNWLILLLPERSQGWDWCLFETGYFRGQMVTPDRLICIYPEGTDLPPMIDEFQAVSSDTRSLEGFLRQVFVSENPLPGMGPINPVVEDKIPELALELRRCIQLPQSKSTVQRVHLDNYLLLAIDEPENMHDVSDLLRGTIAEINAESLRLFDFREQPETFGELVGGVRDDAGGEHWLHELRAVIKKIASGRNFTPVQSTFQALSDQKLYRPSVHAVDKLGDGAMQHFYILFLEELGSMNMRSVPDELRELSLAVRFAFRFRWEVLEPFKDRPVPSAQIKALKAAIERIERDAAVREFNDPNVLLSQFGVEDRADIQAMYEFWGELKNVDRDGRMDRAFSDDDGATLGEILDELLPLNHRYLQLVIERFAHTQ